MSKHQLRNAMLGPLLVCMSKFVGMLWLVNGTILVLPFIKLGLRLENPAKELTVSEPFSQGE